MLQLRGMKSLGVAFWLLTVSSPLVTAWAADIYTVADIRVDERANDEVSAKSTGIAKGQRDALRLLLERMTLRADHDRLPAVTDELVSQTLRDFAVSDEKFGGGRYLATLSLRFKPDEVRDILRANGVPFAEVQSRPNLLLPVYQNAGATVLWDEPNPWFDAWLRREMPTGLVPLVLPLRDLSDISEISADQAVAGDAARLQAIAEKYHAFGTVVAAVQPSIDPVTNVPTLEVQMTTLPPGEAARVVTRTVRGGETEAMDALFDRATDELIVDLEEAWKRDNLEQPGSQQQIRVVVPVTRLGQWLDVKRKMSSVPSVKELTVARLSVHEAEVDLTFLGQPDQLRRALAQKDLDMTYAIDKNAWVVRSKSTE
jgi:Uncharacterized protein conserved in bacteria (DUF2066)